MAELGVAAVPRPDHAPAAGGGDAGTEQFGARFFGWVAQHEGSFVHPHLQTQAFDGMTGIACTEPLRKGDLVIRVPLAACGRLLSAQPAGNQGLRTLQAALRPVCARQTFREKSGAQYAELALQVLLNSAPLFSIYREHFVQSSQPVMAELFSESELDALQSRKLAELVRSRRAWARNLLRELPWADSGHEPQSLEHFLAALHLVRSHAHRVHVSKDLDEAETDRNYTADSDILALVPGIDLANHAFDCTAECTAERKFIGASQCFEIRARRELAAGTQICFDYSDGNRSPMPNYQLLMTYGFVPPANPSDELLVDFRDEFRECFLAADAVESRTDAQAEKSPATELATELAPEPELEPEPEPELPPKQPTDLDLHKRRLRLLQRAGATSSKQSTGFFVKGHIIVRRSDCDARAGGGNILKWARIMTAPLELLAQPSTEGLLLSGRPVNMESEMAALRLVVTKIIAWIGSAPTTYSEDEALLAADKAFSAAEHAAAGGRALGDEEVVSSKREAKMSDAMTMAVTFRRERKLLANDLLVLYGKRKRSVMLQRREMATRQEAAANAESMRTGESVTRHSSHHRASRSS